jgi:large subunit ribosomal protein L15
MMPRKKVVKQRGHRTHGYGSPKKHRGKGSRGGRGMAGSEGHRRTFLLKYKPGYAGKSGFRSKTGKKLKTINLRNLVNLAGKEKKIDLATKGYDKVLGTGEINVKLEVKADYFSKSAKEKIEKAGGKAIGSVTEVTAEEETGAVEEVVEEPAPVEDTEEETQEKPKEKPKEEAGGESKKESK